MEKMKNNKWRRIPILVMLVFALCVTTVMMIGFPITASAAEDNTYIAADGTSAEIPTDATTVSSSDTAWNAGWYVVDSDVAITDYIMLTGDVHLVLKDNCSLTITGSINYSAGTPALTIYGQSGGNGTLTVNYIDDSYVSSAIEVRGLTINGGIVNATASSGVGAHAFYVAGGEVTINGGTVNATATATGEDKKAYGIVGNSISFNGGTVNVTATNTNGTAYAISGDTTISGGTMTLNAAGKDADNTFLFNRTMSVNDTGTLVLPDTMFKTQVMALGITGTGGIKYGNAHIDTAGNCITHNWTAKIRQKDTTRHYTEVCSICDMTNEATVASCEYDNACDTNCNICGIVRTITHQYDGNGFCTVCRYSDTPAVDSDGDGLLEIDSAAKLWWFTYQVKDGQNDLNAELTANIDLAGTCGEGIGNWLPIGNSYSGHFNGQGFTVSNLYIESDEQYAGLFGYVKGATIENVTVTGSVSSTFYYSYNPDTYESFEGLAGGVVAHLDGGTIRNCESNVAVTGGYEFGGICGRLSSGIIEDCINYGTIIRDLDSTDTVYYGGIVGYMLGGTVRGCTNHYGVSGSYANIGGIVGMVGEGTVENCINLSNIAGTQYTNAGGIAGKLWIYGAIRNCGNLGTVTGDYTDYVGGITGCSEGDIEHCWNIASVSGTSEYVGPIAGLNRDDYGVITNSYYLSDTTTEDGGRTAEQFASGQVAYELNGSTTADDSVWKQTLETDSYPTLTGENVYYVTSKKCDGTVIENLYSNSSEDIIVHEDANDNSFCDLCNWLIITEKTFPDANFRTYISDNFDTDKDGLLSPEEIEAVWRIDVADKGISDLSGIAYFTNLSELFVNGNDLTTLNVSQNKELTILCCGQNQLSALDVSQNTELVELYCYENLFTSLDVSANGKLAVLDCGDNPNLTSLKVSPAIVMIDVANTALRSLDLSECSLLESLDYNNTNLTSLELPAHFLLDAPDDYSEISLDIDQKTMVLDLRDFVADVSRVTIVNNSATIVGNYLYISSGATQVNYTYDTGAAEGSLLHAVIININNPHTHSFDENGYCADCGLQAIIRVDVAFNNKYFTTTSFADALALAREGGYTIPAVITLFDDVTVDEAVSLRGGTQILDLNGHTLTFTATNDTPFTLIAGTFTIRDSSTAQTGTIYHDVRGNEERTVIALTDSTALVLESGTLDFSAVTAAIAVEDGSIMQQRGGKITTPILLNNGRYELDDGTIETTYPYAFIIDSDGSAWYYIEITGGTVSVNDTLGSYGLLHFPHNGCTETVTITGGTFRNTSDKPFMICVYHSDAQVSITGGVFEQGLICTALYKADPLSLSTGLASGYAFYDADGNPVALTDDQTEIAGYVTVDECTHIFGDYLSDAEGHWHECKACGATDTKLAHTPEDDDGTCLTALFCSDCHIELQVAKDDHDFSGEWVYNDNGHWHKCENCDEISEEIYHSGNGGGDCTKDVLCVCGYVISEGNPEHDFSNADNVFYDDTHHFVGCANCGMPKDDSAKVPHDFSILKTDEYDHWYQCSGCEKESVHIEHSGDNGGDCTKDSICSCEYVTKTGETAHDFSGEYLSDADGHYHKCANCDVIDEKLAHTPEEDDWTCLTAVLCSACGYETTKGQIIHDFNNANLYDSEGHWHKCSRCDQTAAKFDHTDTDFDSVCDECDANVTHIDFSKVSLTLGGDIGINFFFTLGDTVIGNDTAYFLVTYPDGGTERIAVSDDLLGTPKGDTSGNTYYKVSAYVAAKEMADKVKVELFVNEIPVKAFNYSIQQYANVIFADASSEAGLVELVKKMLNYGAASQIALGYNTDKLANSVLSDADKTVNAVDASTLTGAATSGTVSGFEYQMFSCILETKTTLRQYFTLTEGSVSEYSFMIDGKSVTPTEISVEGKTMYYINVTNIAARDMDIVHTLVITKGGETRTITCSVHSYIKAVLTKNSEDVALVNTIHAMYEYGEAAKQYLAS